MSGDRVVYDREWEVFRIRTDENVLLGTEYSQYPCGWDSRSQAEDVVERRAEMADYLCQLRESR